MSRINRVPYGLQDLLGSQNFGDNPSELGGVVSPVLDMYQFMKLERREFVINAAGSTRTTPGNFSNIVVPQGEIWMVEMIGATMNKNAAWVVGEQVVITAALDAVVNSTFPTVEHPLGEIGSFECTGAASSGLFYFTKVFENPLILVGGETIYHVCSHISITTSNVAFNPMLSYTKLNV